MRHLYLVIAACFFILEGAAPAAAQEKTRVIVLGVDHSAQLVSRAYRPAVMEVFFDRAKPDAICIERDPENFAINDYYEFTYEVSEIAVPYARDHRLGICPFDWLPSKGDQQLGFGLELDAPPVTRPAQGFQGFLTFPDKSALTRGLFWAEDRAALKEWDAFADTASKNPGPELSRRLFLYRTALQAKRIGQAARAWRGKTMLVVVGAYHARDIKIFLAADPRIELVDASNIGTPSEAEAAALDRPRYLLAALSYNLLGRQSATGQVDWHWMSGMLDALEAKTKTPETRLLRLRLQRLTGKIGAKAAIDAYRSLAAETPEDALFTWTGVKDRSRIDSFFDPFGSLTIRQRAQVELARELIGSGLNKQAEAIRDQLASALGGGKATQLAGYWPMLKDR